MITFSNYTQAQGQNVPSLSPSYPFNQSGQVMLAFVNVFRTDGTSPQPVLTTPSGWTVTITNGTSGLGVYRAVLQKLGDGSVGSVVFAFDTNIRGNIDILVYDEIDTTTPVQASSFHNATGASTTHTATAVTTTLPNSMLVGGFFSVDTGVQFFDSSDLPNTRVNLAGAGFERPTLIGDAIQAVAGSSGTKSTTSNLNTLSQEILVALNPAPNPTVPTVVYANGGEVLTAGASVTIESTSSTSPTAAPSTLQYDFDYNSNHGAGSWTSIGLSSAGVTTKSWTVPTITGNGYRLRVRAKDPALGIFSLAYDESDASFSVVAEVAPPAPVVTAPSAGSVHNKASVVTISWTHGGGRGNPQTEYTIQWSRDNFASHTATVGPTSSAANSTTIDFSGEASGTVISLKVKTKGVTLYSPYSSIRTFTVASVPATPNITAPTAGSPPTTPFPTVTFTEADPFVSRRMRVTQGGVEQYDSGFVGSTALSFTSLFSFANGVASVLFLSVKNAYGLASAEDSETFTPAYTGPTAATATYNVLDNGAVSIAISNTGSMTYNEIWRYVNSEGIGTAIKIATEATGGLPANASFIDYNVKSGTAYKYFIRTYNSTGKFTDSSVSATQTITLVRLSLHAVSRTNTNSNASGNQVLLWNQEGTGFGIGIPSATIPILGRGNVGVRGEVEQGVMNVSALIPTSESSSLTDLMAIFRSGLPVCARDQVGKKIFGRMTLPNMVLDEGEYRVSFQVLEDKYVEGLI